MSVGIRRGITGKRTVTSAKIQAKQAESAEAESQRTEAVACAAGEVKNTMVDGFEIPMGLWHLTREEIRKRNYGRKG